MVTPGLDVGAVGALGVDAVQEDGWGAGVIAAVIAGSAGRCHLVREVADDDQLVA